MDLKGHFSSHMYTYNPPAVIYNYLGIMTLVQEIAPCMPTSTLSNCKCHDSRGPGIIYFPYTMCVSMYVQCGILW